MRYHDVMARRYGEAAAWFAYTPSLCLVENWRCLDRVQTISGEPPPRELTPKLPNLGARGFDYHPLQYSYNLVLNTRVICPLFKHCVACRYGEREGCGVTSEQSPIDHGQELPKLYQDHNRHDLRLLSSDFSSTLVEMCDGTSAETPMSLGALAACFPTTYPSRLQPPLVPEMPAKLQPV